MTAAKDTEKPEVEAKAKPAAKQSGKRLMAVYADLVHPEDATRFTTDNSVRHEVDWWCQIQMDAGKLVEDEG